jgi:hypothetical protein
MAVEVVLVEEYAASYLDFVGTENAESRLKSDDGRT